MLETERESRPLSTTAAIALAGIAAASVFGAGVVIAERVWGPHVAATPSASASTPAVSASAPPTAAPPPAASAIALDPRASQDRPPIAPPPTASAAAAPPATSAAPPAASLPPQFGYLTVRGREGARVYVNGADIGPANQALKAPCGLKFVRLGTATEGARPPSWLSPGQSVAIGCRAATEIDAGSPPG